MTCNCLFLQLVSCSTSWEHASNPDSSIWKLESNLDSSIWKLESNLDSSIWKRVSNPDSSIWKWASNPDSSIWKRASNPNSSTYCIWRASQPFVISPNGFIFSNTLIQPKSASKATMLLSTSTSSGRPTLTMSICSSSLWPTTVRMTLS